MSLPHRDYIQDFWKDDAVSLLTMTTQRHINVSPGRKTTTAVCKVVWRGLTEAHRAKACVCDGCCHTEADRLARCEGGDLPGLSGHV